MAQVQGLSLLFGTLLGAQSSDITGSVVATLDAATLSSDATAQQGISGDLSVTLGEASLSSSASLDNFGSLSVTLEAATLSAAGQFNIVADLSVALAAATLDATGTVEIPASEGFGVGGPQVYDVFPIIGIAELYNVRHRTH